MLTPGIAVLLKHYDICLIQTKYIKNRNFLYLNEHNLTKFVYNNEKWQYFVCLCYFFSYYFYLVYWQYCGSLLITMMTLYDLHINFVLLNEIIFASVLVSADTLIYIKIILCKSFLDKQIKICIVTICLWIESRNIFVSVNTYFLAMQRKDDRTE